MGAKPVALSPTYGAQSGQVAMALLDGTKQAEQDAFNDVATYANAFLDTGGVNTPAITTAPLALTLTFGVQFDVFMANTNTGPCTLNVNATGAVPVVDATGAALGAGTLIANTVYNFIYDGTSYRVSGVAAGGGVGPGSFSTLTASGAVTGAGFNALFASPPADIGSVAPSQGFFTNLSVAGVSSFTGLVTARNVSIVPVAGTGLSVKSASGAHSTQIADTANTLFNAGYLGVPKSANTTAALSDRGKTIHASGPIVIPNAIFTTGDAFMIFNLTGAAISISSPVINVRLAGTTTLGSPRSLAPFGLAFIYFWDPNGFAISGDVS